MNAELAEGLAIDEEAGLKPRDLLRRPVLERMVLPQRIEQNVERCQLETAFLVLRFHLLLDQILDK